MAAIPLEVLYGGRRGTKAGVSLVRSCFRAGEIRSGCYVLVRHSAQYGIQFIGCYQIKSLNWGSRTTMKCSKPKSEASMVPSRYSPDSPSRWTLSSHLRALTDVGSRKAKRSPKGHGPFWCRSHTMREPWMYVIAGVGEAADFQNERGIHQQPPWTRCPRLCVAQDYRRVGRIQSVSLQIPASRVILLAAQKPSGPRGSGEGIGRSG